MVYIPPHVFAQLSSKERLIVRFAKTDYCTSAGFIDALVRRYLRRIKYTSYSEEKTHNLFVQIFLKLKIKYHIDHRSPCILSSPYYLPRKPTAYINTRLYWLNGELIEDELKIKKTVDFRDKTIHYIEAPAQPVIAPKFRTTKAKERAILQAVYEMGLITEEDLR